MPEKNLDGNHLYNSPGLRLESMDTVHTIFEAFPDASISPYHIDKNMFQIGNILTLEQVEDSCSKDRLLEELMLAYEKRKLAEKLPPDLDIQVKAIGDSDIREVVLLIPVDMPVEEVNKALNTVLEQFSYLPEDTKNLNQILSSAKETIPELIDNTEKMGVYDSYVYYDLKQRIPHMAQKATLEIATLPPEPMDGLAVNDVMLKIIDQNAATYQQHYNEMKDKLYEAAEKHFYISPREGNEPCVIELNAYYNETNNFLLQTAYDSMQEVKENTSIEHPDSFVLHSLQEKIWVEFEDEIYDAKERIIESADLENDEDAPDILDDIFSVVPPESYFLNQSMRINIEVCGPNEGNRDYTDIAAQQEAIYALEYPEKLSPAEFQEHTKALNRTTGLTILLENQGYSMEDFATTLRDYNHFFYDENGAKSLDYEAQIAEFSTTHNKFLTSLAEELDNATYDMNVMTVLAEVSMNDFALLANSETKITLPKNAMIGLFNPWNGSGSLMGIELEKDLTLTCKNIRDIQVEGVKCPYEYTVNIAFDLISSSWKEAKSVTLNPAKTQYKAVDDLIHAAKGKSEKVEAYLDKEKTKGPSKDQGR